MADELCFEEKENSFEENTRSRGARPATNTLTRHRYTKHGESSSAYKYPFLHGVSSALLVEPHVESALRISSPAFGASYAWTFEGGLAQVGSSITVSPEGTGLQSLSVVETVGGAVSRERLFTCYIKYVRRELRQLSARDRERFLDASATLWRVDTLEGRALYGDEYVGIHHLAIIHNDLAGNPICDFIHGTHTSVVLQIGETRERVSRGGGRERKRERERVSTRTSRRCYIWSSVDTRACKRSRPSRTAERPPPARVSSQTRSLHTPWKLSEVCVPSTC